MCKLHEKNDVSGVSVCTKKARTLSGCDEVSSNQVNCLLSVDCVWVVDIVQNSEFTRLCRQDHPNLCLMSPNLPPVRTGFAHTPHHTLHTAGFFPPPKRVLSPRLQHQPHRVKNTRPEYIKADMGTKRTTSGGLKEFRKLGGINILCGSVTP